MLLQTLSPQVRTRLFRSARRRRWRVGLLVGLLVASLMLILNLTQSFQRGAAWISDLLYVSQPISGEVIIVAIDDGSLARFGRSVSDWPRTLHAELLEWLSTAGARVVGFDVLFIEETRDDARFAEAIRTARQSEARTRTVLAIAAKQDQAATTNETPRFTEMLPLAPALRDIALSGHVNFLPDADGFVRRMIPELTTANGTHLLFDISLYLSYLRVPDQAHLSLVKRDGNTVQVAERQITLDSNQLAYINFFGPPGTFPIIPFWQVHQGLADPSLFEGKIVLVGVVNAAGASDTYLTPMTGGTARMSGVEIHANILEGLIQNRPLRPNVLPLALLFGSLPAFSSSLIFAQLRWRWAVPVYVLLVLIAWSIAAFAFSIGLLATRHFYTQLGLFLALAATLLVNLYDESRRRHQVESLYDSASRLINQKLDLPTLLGRVDDEMRRLLSSDRGVVVLAAPYNSMLEIPVAPFPNFALDSLHQASVLPKASSAQGVDPYHYAITPLRFQQNLIGAAIAIFNVPPTSEQVLLLEIYGEELAPAIANAALYTEQTQQNALLAAILTSAPEPIWVLSRSGEILRANRAAAAILGQEIEHKRLIDSLSAIGLTDDHQAALQTHLSTARPFKHEISLNERSFVVQGALLSETLTNTQLARVLHAEWVILLNDITELKQLNQLRSNMIRMVSHDLRNPLSIVMGLSELLQDNLRGTDDGEMVNLILRAAEDMRDLIRDLLDFERIHAGRLIAELFDMVSVIQSVINNVQAEINKKKQHIHLEISEPILPMNGDRRLMHEALMNLVSNASKYTPEGGQITISAKQNANSLEVAVRDNGYGIPREAQAKLFEPFYRVRTSETAAIPGTGLGLSLVQMVVKAHQGQITVDSNLGQGSTFTMILPIGDEDET